MGQHVDFAELIGSDERFKRIDPKNDEKGPIKTATDQTRKMVQYAEQVRSGEIPACKYVKLAVDRFFRDWDRIGEEDFAYDFDFFKAYRVWTFISQMPHVKGTWEKSTIDLVGWQLFVVGNVFGWVHAEYDEDWYRNTLKTPNPKFKWLRSGNPLLHQYVAQLHCRLRKYRYVYIEVARKNAKSTLTSGVGNYLLLEDDEPGAEVYSAATTRDQAAIVFNDCQGMLRKSPKLQSRHDYVVGKYSIYVQDTNSKMMALSADAHTLDGLNIHGALIDELHAHKTSDVYGVLKTGTGSRRQSLLWAITTAGFNLDGVCYEQRQYVIKMLEGAVEEDQSYFALVYTLDDEDIETEAWMHDPKVWVKANPNMGVSKFESTIKQECQQAISILSERNNFLTKHLDVWTNSDVAWMDMLQWKNCSDTNLKIEDFAGRKAIVTVDLSSNKDLTAVSYLLYDDVFSEGRIDISKKLDGNFYLFVDFFLPEETLKTVTNRDMYDGWVRGGYITATPGNRIDQLTILRSIEAKAEFLDIPEIAYDPWNATQFALAANHEGFEIMEYRMSTPNLNEAMKELEGAVLAGQLKHTGCPVLTWNMSNVIAKKVGDRDIRPAKESEGKKIDGAVAGIMGFGRHVQMLVEAPPPAPTVTRF